MAVRVSELGKGAAKAGNGHAKAGNGHARAALGSYGDLDDRMLVLDFQAGNGEAFAEIHRRYFGLARHVCQRILRNPEDADEAAQEAMLRVYQGLPRFNGRYALQPWVARIATNVSLDVTRARARRPRTGDQVVTDLDEDLHDRLGDPQEAVERALDREQINQVLAELPNHHREALVLRELEGRSHKEIGEAMGVTPSQAKALIHRAKGSFKRAWNGGNGLQAFMFLVAPIAKMPHLIKRVLQPAQELAATSAAAPAAGASVVTTGERITAAAVAVLVTGAAAVGAVALKQPQPKPKPAPTPSVQPVVPETKPELVLVPDTRQNKDRKSKAKVMPPVVVSPSATPAPAETPPPSESTSPPPPPPPPWTMGFQVSAPDYECGCGPMSQLSGTVHGEAGRDLTFQQTAEGPAPDASGAEGAWRLKVGLFGTAHGSTGAGGFWLYLYEDDRYYEYEAEGQLASVSELEDGGYRYTYIGTYNLITTPDQDEDPTLHEGTFEFNVDFWGDGTSLYRAQVSVRESDA